ncbi:antA/AntB antirepressor family protein [Epilithonimonas xixisoli]|uniref:Phage anti-repressor protein n=1 Tax=Epilithonimonas xixisoli TaxID=1476462 RepID=A0A4R8IE06_9FLAO|nr:antA/AntB antirepressor family protein [Epilithonimonas xixisoli]TDX83938.1 phage anti-repressor protein [Epilithonimonas xixisoli]
MELIKITEQNGKQAVSARELYLYLGYDKSQYSRWYKKHIIENSFSVENEDYQGFDTFVEGNEVKDFALSLDFAKKLCMISKTKVGEKVRDYFIDCEKKLKGISIDFNNPDTVLMLAQNWKNEKDRADQLQISNARLQNRSDVYDKVFGAEKYLTGSQVCKVLDLGYGNITLYKKLREIGIFFKNKNEPMQQYANKKWVMLKEKWIEGKEEPVVTPYFSQTFIPHLAMKLGAVTNHLTKIQSA